MAPGFLQRCPTGKEFSRNNVPCRQETFDLLSSLREPTDQERKEVGARKGILLPVKATSLGQFYSENQPYFGWVNESRSLRDYTPPLAFKVAVFPDKRYVSGSNNSSQVRQLQMTEDYSKKKIEPVFSGAKAIMLPATVLAQLDVEFQKRNNGAKLFQDFWVRALDTTVDPNVANVGRAHPDNRLNVNDWNRDVGHLHVWAFPAVVFVRK